MREEGRIEAMREVGRIERGSERKVGRIERGSERKVGCIERNAIQHDSTERVMAAEDGDERSEIQEIEESE